MNTLTKSILLLLTIVLVSACKQDNSYYMCYLTANDGQYITLMKELSIAKAGIGFASNAAILENFVLALLLFALVVTFYMVKTKDNYSMVANLIIGCIFIIILKLAGANFLNTNQSYTKDAIKVENKLVELKKPDSDVLHICKSPSEFTITNESKSYYKMNPNQLN